MVCIYCQGVTQVINSRHQKKHNHVWRRRRCVECNSVFTTLERPDYLQALSVIRKSGYEDFSRDKLFVSIYASLKHRKTAINDSTALTDTIISKLSPLFGKASITPTQIIETALVVLGHFDKAAVSYYAAYHPL